MTRDDFMAKALETVRQILKSKENGIMNLVQQAWAEGKRNAEVETLKQAVVEAFTNSTATVDRSHEIGYEDKIPDGKDEYSVLYKGKSVKCQLVAVKDTPKHEFVFWEV